MQIDAQIVGRGKGCIGRAPGVETDVVDAVLPARKKYLLPARQFHRRMAGQGKDAGIVLAAEKVGRPLIVNWVPLVLNSRRPNGSLALSRRSGSGLGVNVRGFKIDLQTEHFGDELIPAPGRRIGWSTIDFGRATCQLDIRLAIACIDLYGSTTRGRVRQDAVLFLPVRCSIFSADVGLSTRDNPGRFARRRSKPAA